ncbi:hypothetical protein ACO03V_14485 [Microbacterium sp. HMH0099]|uniref:hypothetical protein n=1 Tax=Microbacterium sp. HMH0099 TaxID=3414026 RepID=UPI003BF6F5B3
MPSISHLMEIQRGMDQSILDDFSAVKPVTTAELRQLMDAEYERREANWQTLPISLGGETVDVSIGEVPGGTWQELFGNRPARTDADRPYEYDRAAVARDFPVERIRVNDERISQDTWGELFDMLDAEDQTNIEAVMWGLHIGEPQQRAEKLRRERRLQPSEDLAPNEELAPRPVPTRVVGATPPLPLCPRRR